MSGFVYLLHFSRPISPNHTTQHYLGWADELAKRIQCHRSGNGARLTEVAHDRGISFEVVRVWRGGRTAERRLKNRKEAPRLCPLCSAHPRPVNSLAELSIDDQLILR